MTYDVRWILVLLANLLLILLTAELNHTLSMVSLHIYIGGLLLTFGVLRLGLKQGLLANGITALFLDAANPLPFGGTFFLILLCHTITFSLRGNFARESARSGLLIAVGLNVTLMFGLGVLAAQNLPTPGIYWGRIALEMFLSSLVILVIASWYFSLQTAALAFLGIDLDAEQREAI